MERIVYEALCQDPYAFGLRFDRSGYVECELLLDSIYRKEAALIREADLKRIARKNSKPFYEIKGSKIRMLQT